LDARMENIEAWVRGDVKEALKEADLSNEKADG